MNFLQYGSAGAIGFLIGLAAVVWIEDLNAGGIFLIIAFCVAVATIIFALAKLLLGTGGAK
ncbi:MULTISPECIES: hypothetical protein [unclassified Mesorhizobium]|uniref:hypothetical protein n=1 Tax=unclassified Mesorhizobium TaxID=325217 RepID=UPI000FD510BB|nr:hypothetical protein [Mesorhizobium sp. M7A.F.Ca.MR.176.00.0.0]RUU93106.1 hypothetical protein EOB59_04745 [Mesorhizobium sp. M7A.F.Ca.MR.176.00.0.0]